MTTPYTTTTQDTVAKEDINFWRHHAKNFKQSGLKRNKYCRINNVNYDRFAYWLKRLSKTSSQPLVPVKLISTTSSPKTSVITTLCTLTFKNGSCLQIHDEAVLTLILEKMN